MGLCPRRVQHAVRGGKSKRCRRRTYDPSKPRSRQAVCARRPACPASPARANRNQPPPCRAPSSVRDKRRRAARPRRARAPTTAQCGAQCGSFTQRAAYARGQRTAPRWRWRTSLTPSYACRHSAAHSARGRTPLPPMPLAHRPTRARRRCVPPARTSAPGLLLQEAFSRSACPLEEHVPAT